MAKRGATRRGRAGKGIVSRIYSPFNHFFMASGESVRNVSRSTGNIVKRAINTVDSVGKRFATHTNRAISNVVSRRGSRRSSRHATRRSSRRSH